MWVLSGPFDGSEVGKTEHQKPKLLKPNASYPLGRKGQPLIIRHKKVSHDHCEFFVGPHTVDDAGDPSSKPLLEVLNKNKKDKKMAIYRGAKEIPVNIESSGRYELQDGDYIALVGGVRIDIKWQPLCAYSLVVRGKGSISLEACAALGIKLVYKPHSDITHHLIPHYVATLSTATSLLSLACLVKPEWLQEILRLGSLPATDESATGTYLEDQFVLPAESTFRPTFSPSLLPSQKKFGVWERNEARLNMFKPCRFVCFREKVTESDTQLGEAIHRGEGTLENFDVHQGVLKLHQALTRSHAKQVNKVVVVADTDAMQAAVGREAWEEYINEAKSCSLEILPPAKVIQAVLDADANILFPSVSNDAETSAGPSRNISPLPSVVPNTISDEPSMSTEDSWNQTGRRRLVRRTTSSASREPSVAPAPEPDPLEELMARPRRVLTRRVADPPFITGLDDPSIVIDAVPILTTPPRERDASAPTPARRVLKRRVGVENPDGAAWGNSLAPLSGIAETLEEPPLKKFKALFDATNPESTTDWESLALGESLLGASEGVSETQTQTQSGRESQQAPPPAQQQRALGMTPSSLAVLREEEEEVTQSGMAPPAGQRGQKRGLETLDEDVEMEDGAGAAGPPAKRRAMENGLAGEPAAATAGKPPSTAARAKEKEKHAGAPAGKPDTDSAFLKAIASTKRGKKTEDVFDREFNQLKISKPEMEKRDPEEEWAVLAEFGDDSGLRGNFMTVVEMDVYRADDRQQERALVNREWDGKPNFKKFKKKVTGVVRAKVEVFLAEENDYGMGSAYWKGGNSQAVSQTQNTIFASQSQMQSQPNDDSQNSPPPRVRMPSTLDSDEEIAPVRKARKAPARAASAVPKKAAARSKPAPKKPALFLDSDDDMGGGDGAADASDVDRDDRAESMTLRSDGESPGKPTRAKRTAAKSRAPAPIIVDDDSDGGVFKGFKGRKGKGKK